MIVYHISCRSGDHICPDTTGSGKGYVSFRMKAAGHIYQSLVLNFCHRHGNDRYSFGSSWHLRAARSSDDLDVNAGVRLQAGNPASPDRAGFTQGNRSGIRLVDPVRFPVESQLGGQARSNLGDIPPVPGRIIKGGRSFGI